MTKKFEYIIHFEDGTSNSFAVDVDPETFIIRDNDAIDAPEWTLLDYQKCENCPYKSEEKKYCPVAKNLAATAEKFKEERSFKKLTVFVKSEERMYGKKTDLQTALFSLFGLIMASSSCAHLHMFKPMARFHLPFSSVEETQMRVLGMYLISEFLKFQEDPNHSIGLSELTRKFEQIGKVNQGIIQRIRSLKGGDANKNAVIALDNFASLLPIEVSSGLSEVKSFFT